MYNPNNDPVNNNKIKGYLSNSIRTHDSSNLHVIMDDFNSVCNLSLDRSNSHSSAQHKKPSEIIQLLQQHDYIDLYRFLHSDNRTYTWKSSSNEIIQTRIDYV